MRSYIYGVQNGIHVFDLSKTAERLEAARSFLDEQTLKGKTVLIVATKLQARDIAQKLAMDTGHMYVVSKWVPGLITNFATIKKRIISFNKLDKDLATGALDSMFTKAEISVKAKELAKLREAYEGVRDIRRLPDVVLVVDGFCERLALVEARKAHIPAVALMGSTGDADLADYVVPMNVNTTKALEFVLGYLKSALHAPKKQEALPVQQGVRQLRDDTRRGPRRDRQLEAAIEAVDSAEVSAISAL